VLVDRAGREFQAEITRRRIETKDGILVMSVIREIGDRGRIGGVLRESEERYRKGAETAADVIFGASEDGRLLFVSSSVDKGFGYKPSEVVGAELTRLMPDFMSRLREVARRSADKGQKRAGRSGVELKGLRKGGKEVPVEIAFGEYTAD